MIHYNFAAISAAADDINRTRQNLDGILDDLKASLQPLVAEWEGESATSYQASQRAWDEAAAELNLVLTQVATTVHDTNARMSDINASAARSWMG